MFILEKPYVSEYLIDTIVKNDWTILDNTTIEEVDIEADDLHLITTEKAKKYYLSQEYPFIYGNSEKSGGFCIYICAESGCVWNCLSYGNDGKQPWMVE